MQDLQVCVRDYDSDTEFAPTDGCIFAGYEPKGILVEVRDGRILVVVLVASPYHQYP